MEILYVGTLPPHNGGSAINASQLLEGFVARGHSVRAICPTTSGLEKTPGPNGVDLTRFTMPSFEASPDQPAPDGYREQQKQEIDRIFPRMVNPAQPPVVIIGREIFVLDVAELALSHRLHSVLWAQGATTWGMLNGSLGQPVTRQLLVEMRKVDRVVTVARHMEAALRELGIGKIETVTNGVDVDRFRPGPGNPELLERLKIPSDHLVVLHASNMKELKRPRDLLAAAEIVKKTESRVTWIMVGDGPILNDVRRLCRDRGLDDQFRFTGWVDHMTMPGWFNLADLVVMPSAREGLALVYLEAQASGCVLLASDIPAAREVITDGDNGLLFPPGNAAEIAGQVLRLGRDPVTRRQIGERARETVHNHRLGASVSRHLRILEEVSGVRIEPVTGQAVI